MITRIKYISVRRRLEVKSKSSSLAASSRSSSELLADWHSNDHQIHDHDGEAISRISSSRRQCIPPHLELSLINALHTSCIPSRHLVPHSSQFVPFVPPLYHTELPLYSPMISLSSLLPRSPERIPRVPDPYLCGPKWCKTL